jgi:hypothetical protein
MKLSIKTLLAFGCAYAITATSSFAQVYTFDENGNSTGPGISPGKLQPDPSGGLTVPVLVYTLPFAVTPGDLYLQENGVTSQTFSDLARFFSPAGANFTDIIFYSDVEVGEPNTDLADTGLPNNGSPTPVFIPETGTEGNNGAVWNPGPGEPGSLLTGGTIQYNIISDVPEPSTVALAVMGGGLVMFTLKRRQQANT